MDRFDVVVAGGGTAGCVLAARLSEEPGRSVCLVEAGPDYGPYDAGRWPADLLDARKLAFSHAWETDRDDRSQLRARVLGGCSAHNACVVLRGVPSDYDWGDGWSYADLEPFFARAEERLGARPIERDALTPWHDAFAAAGDDDTILYQVNAAGDVRWNAAFAYIDPARGRTNLTILPDTIVDRVDHADGRARSVVTSRGELRAATVVLGAGAYGTPGILLRSGIGPETGLPVGENLRDHVGTGIGWEPTERLLDELRPLGDVLPMGQMGIGPREGELFLFPAIDDGPEISAGAFAMQPSSVGRVRLNGPDPRTPLAIEHGFLSDPADAEDVADGIAELRELAESPEVRPFIARETRPGPEVEPLAHVRATARGFFHPVGTCALGAVAEPDGRVRGFDNLYVGDASFIPSLPRVPINPTVAAVAERLATML